MRGLWRLDGDLSPVIASLSFARLRCCLAIVCGGLALADAPARFMGLLLRLLARIFSSLYVPGKFGQGKPVNIAFEFNDRVQGYPVLVPTPGIKLGMLGGT